MKIETGLMIIKDGLAWGVAYADARDFNYWWVKPEDAIIYDPNKLKSPEDVAYDRYLAELKDAKIVPVMRKTEVFFEE